MKKTKMLKKNYEFRYVLSKGTYYSGKNIEAFIKKSNKNYNLLGIAIGTKITNAVNRNKIKRQVRFLVDNYKKEFKNSSKYIIMIKNTCKNVPFNEMNTSFASLIKEIK